LGSLLAVESSAFESASVPTEAGSLSQLKHHNSQGILFKLRPHSHSTLPV